MRRIEIEIAPKTERHIEALREHFHAHDERRLIIEMIEHAFLQAQRSERTALNFIRTYNKQTNPNAGH